jgi:ABC-type uncharacterized transport system involved in gliding motility auxiliary subunit
LISVKGIYFDVSKSKYNTLSTQTVNLLEQLDFDVDIKVYYPDNSLRDISNLLQKYQSKNPRLKIEYIDPIKNPLRADEFEVKTPKTIIFKAGDKITRLEPSQRTLSHGERDISVGLFRLTTDQNKTIYFTTGHGELSIEDTRSTGLSIIAQRLEEQSLIVKSVNLLEEGKVPDDCTVLVMAGFKVPLTKEEVSMVETYAQNKGRVIVMMNPGEVSGLDNMFNEYALFYGNDYIYETSKKMTLESGGPVHVFCSPFDESEITDNLPNQMFYMPYVRSVNSFMAVDGVEKVKLLVSSPDSWAETDIKSAETVRTNVKPARDKFEMKGPISVAITIERGFYLLDSENKLTSNTETRRSAFFGNSRFISNVYVSGFPSNTNLFLNTVNWITRNENFLTLVPHVRSFTPVDLKESQKSILLWITYVFFPLSIVFAGLIVWYKRR